MANQNVTTTATEGNSEEMAQLQEFFDGLSKEELMQATLDLADIKDATGKGWAESFAIMQGRKAEAEFEALTNQLDRLNLMGAAMQSMEFDEQERYTAATMVKEACSLIFQRAEALLKMAMAVKTGK